jgi:lactoylglutathione lyase
VIRIDHVGLWCDDLDEMTRFYVRYFGASAGPRYHNPAKGFESVFLHFASGARLELMRTTTLEPLRPVPGQERMGLTHLALAVGSEAQVALLTTQLVEDGYELIDGPRRTGDGYCESVVLDPEGNRVDITALPAH